MGWLTSLGWGHGDPAQTPEALAATSARVHPTLEDLLSLRVRAHALPPLARPSRARQNGLYHAPLKGRGMEYAESRPYQPGDDVRTIDWRLTARSGKAHTKLFREERERPVYVGLDLRSSMAFATQGAFKSVQAARTAALLAWKAIHEHDRIGAVLLGAAGSRDVLPARGGAAALRLLNRLVEVAGDRGPAGPPLAQLSAGLQRLTKPGSLVFVLSDLRDFDPAVDRDLARIAQHSDLTLLHFYDLFETALPALDAPLRVTHGALSVDFELGDRALAARYQQRFDARRQHLVDYCRTHRMGYASISTLEDPLSVLKQALA
ncbi:MAG: DUF58 domain-containing protein [Gammaproteobacteria bacterium]|nr:DUF58 domain-containing protein [Gammaproteobacteria bacterium]